MTRQDYTLNAPKFQNDFKVCDAQPELKQALIQLFHKISRWLIFSVSVPHHPANPASPNTFLPGDTILRI